MRSAIIRACMTQVYFTLTMCNIPPLISAFIDARAQCMLVFRISKITCNRENRREIRSRQFKRDMVLYRVHSEPVFTNFYSTLCSRATIFLVVIYCLILVPPAFIAYVTNGKVTHLQIVRNTGGITLLRLVAVCE